jgi:hypothetical protein
VPLPVRDVVGVADPVAGHRDLSAELTMLSHGSLSVATRIEKKRRMLPFARTPRKSGTEERHEAVGRNAKGVAASGARALDAQEALRLRPLAPARAKRAKCLAGGVFRLLLP